MSSISIYNYSNPRDFVADNFAHRKSNSNEFSMRKWAKEMGLKSHSILNFLISGKRPIRLSHVDFLAPGLNLNSQEKLYFQGLIQFHLSKTIEEKELQSLFLNELNPGKNFNAKEILHFNRISHWSYTAILSVCDLTEFYTTAKSLHSKLGHKLSLAEIEGKVSTLKELELLVEDSNGCLKPTYKKVTTKDDVLNKGIQKYHQSTCEQAAIAVEKLPLEEREFQSFAISVNKNKVPKIKELIRHFIARIENETQNDNTDDVYQLNVQFFRLTQDSSFNIKKKEISDIAPRPKKREKGDINEKIFSDGYRSDITF